MTVWGIGFLLGALFFGYLYARLASSTWRGDGLVVDGDHPPEAWPFGDQSWRGVARAWVSIVPCIILCLLAFAAQEIAGVETRGGDVALAVGTLMFVAMAGLLASITFYNRPKFVVPPHLRHEPGLLDARRRAKSAR